MKYSGLELPNSYFSVLTDIRAMWLMNYFPSDNHYPTIKMLPASHYCFSIFTADIWVNCLGSTKPDVHSVNPDPATYAVYSPLFTSCSIVKGDILLLLQNCSTAGKITKRMLPCSLQSLQVKGQLLSTLHIFIM